PSAPATAAAVAVVVAEAAVTAVLAATGAAAVEAGVTVVVAATAAAGTGLARPSTRGTIARRRPVGRT
ncbi:MAG: hypothetical protein QOI19_2912, partial [Thermoleophilaceae bacterium]|nr:hypothetical protein [Thermoleophilaceae bacterium]